MESREALSSGVTVIGAEAPSNYHVAARAENQNPGQIVISTVNSVSPSAVGLAEKKKRGRPRKYGPGPEGAFARTLSPMPISASAPAGEGNTWPGSFEKKKYKKTDEWAVNSVGTNFTPHVITVNTGEDVTMKVISFSQQGPRAICILSANGIISNVTLRQPDSSGGTLTYEGLFEILSLSGSFMPTDSQGARSRSGGMSVSLSSPDGRIVGGSVAGLLVAAGPVQVVVGSFLPGNQQDQKPKKSKMSPISIAYPLLTSSMAVPVPVPEGERDEHHAHAHAHAHAHDDNPSYKRESWGNPMQDGRKTGTDINISVSEV